MKRAIFFGLIYLHYMHAEELKSCTDLKNYTETVYICTTDTQYNARKPADDQVPLIIGNTLNFFNVDSVNENDQSITINLIFAIFWNDTRLFLKNGNGTKSHDIGFDMANNLFNPQLKIKNTKETINKKQVGPGRSDVTFLFGFNGRRYMQHYLEYQHSQKVTLYCAFDFTDYPFDSNYCNLEYGPASHFIDSVVMRPTRIRYEGRKVNFGEGKVKIKDPRLPFTFELEALEPFMHNESGFHYSYARMRIKITRDNYETLLIGFYFPTFIFALLSLISYFISPEIVSLLFRKFP